MSPQRVIQGCRELKEQPGGSAISEGRQRRTGGGRKSAVEGQTGLLEAIEAMVDLATRGDPMKPLRWTSKSLKKISKELQEQGWQVSTQMVGEILCGHLQYRLQGLKKTREGTS